MKLKTISIALLLAALFCGCDKIEAPYVQIVENESVTVEFPDLDMSTVYRKVLLEEFTAHRCPNCPSGHTRIEELHGIFGDTLVTVGIHGTTLATPNTEYPTDFRTPMGNELVNYFAIDGIPAAIINRGYETGGWGMARWQQKIQAVDRSKVYAAIQLVNQFGETAANELKVNAKVTMLQAYPHPLNLSIVLIEDGILSPQMNGSEMIENYIHNHVLRTDVNGIYGTRLTDDGVLQNGESYIYAKSLSFNGKNWNPDNCYVVAFLFDKENNEVLQVEKLKVK